MIVLMPLLIFTSSLAANENKIVNIDGSTGVKPLIEALAIHYQKKNLKLRSRLVMA
jgi:ABC-type phosphate transport system substrate-binding protein